MTIGAGSSWTETEESGESEDFSGELTISLVDGSFVFIGMTCAWRKWSTAGGGGILSGGAR